MSSTDIIIHIFQNESSKWLSLLRSTRKDSLFLKSRSQLDAHHTRHLSLHKPGVIPNASRDISPITPHRHKYELKQKIWPKKTVESWFANHSTDGRLSTDFCLL